MVQFLLTFLISATAQVASPDIRERIIIIDTGITRDMFQKYSGFFCLDGNISFLPEEPDLWDRHGHGTNIAGFILKSVNPYLQCINIIKYTSPGQTGSQAMEYTEKALLHAMRLPKVKYINYSSSGDAFDSSEKRYLEILLKKGIKISVAAGNDKLNLSMTCRAFPACSGIKNKNFAIIGAYGVEDANYGGPITNTEFGCGGTPKLCGTSQATARYTAKIILQDIQRSPHGY